MWSKTCKWIDVSELSYVSPSEYIENEWNNASIKKFIHSKMNEYKQTKTFYMTDRGFFTVCDELESLGADRELVEFIIEKYRDNPNQ